MAQEHAEIVVQATAVARGGATKNIFNVFHFRRTNDALPVTKAGIETAFQASVGAAMLAFLSIDYTQVSTTVRYFDDATDAPTPFAEVGVGAIAGQRMETFVAAVVQLKSATKGRFARGSKHFAPISETSSIGDVLEAADQVRLTAIGTAILAGLTDASGNVWVPEIKSSKAPAQYLVNPVVLRVYDVISFKINKSTGTMRRRKIPSVY